MLALRAQGPMSVDRQEPGALQITVRAGLGFPAVGLVCLSPLPFFSLLLPFPFIYV